MKNLIEKLILKSSDDIKIQILRYLIAGGIAFVVDNGVYNFLVIILNFNHILSNVISFIFGLFTNYFISRQWVFNKKNHNLLKDFALFSIIGVIGLLLSSLIIFLLRLQNFDKIICLSERRCRKGRCKTYIISNCIILEFYWEEDLCF